MHLLHKIWSTLFCIPFLLGLSQQAHAQDELDYLLADDLDSLSYTDSLSIFFLIDSLLNTIEPKRSEMAVRMGYTSRVMNAGRDFGFEQHGLTPGISYYHKSGAFADLTGFWNSDFEPKYYLTVASVGYLGYALSKFSYSGSYDHLFYHDQDTLTNYPLTNSLNGSFHYESRYFFTGVDYSFLWGQQTAHRISLNLSGYYNWRDVGFIDSFSIMPGGALLFGNSLISSIKYDTDLLRRLRDLINRFGLLRVLRAIRNGNLDVSTLREEELTNSFGLMNLSLIAPLSIRINNTSFLLAYTYNIPFELPGEEGLDLANNGFFSISVSQSIPIRKSK